MSRILVVGATSAIAQACCRIWNARGDDLVLAARDPKKLESLVADLRLRGPGRVEGLVLDARAFDTHPAFVDAAWAAFGGLDQVLVSHGTLGDQKASQEDFPVALRELETNFLSVVSLLTPLANRFEAQGRGTLAVVSSVAGDRGRQSNYVYGTAKAAVSTFLQGLRNRLHPSGVRVVTIKPGFVDTPMTAHLPKGPLFASPARVAKGIVGAMDRGRDVVYVPFFWRWIMLIIRAVPEGIFKRTRL